MADIKLIEEARRILADETPLEFDCGTLCGNLCCKDYAPDVGVYLIPGELPLFDGTEEWATFDFHSTRGYDFAPSWKHHRQIPFLRCTGLCSQERHKRPFECRTYPLLPYLHADGQLEMRFSPWAQGVCPLTERYKVEELRPAFVAAAQRAWTVLLRDPEMLDHVQWLTQQLKDWAELPHCEEEE
jgi:hypothetical protein